LIKLTLERFASDDDTTIGALYLDGRFFCFTLEDEYRLEKVSAETRIPAGVYNIALRNEGSMTKRYGQKFPGLHKGMLHLENVPGFEWIYLHIGNTDKHTAGCILLGAGARAKPGDMSIQSSKDAYLEFYLAVVPAAELNQLYIEIIDRDRG
jgi:hypothetical protein